MLFNLALRERHPRKDLRRVRYDNRVRPSRRCTRRRHESQTRAPAGAAPATESAVPAGDMAYGGRVLRETTEVLRIRPAGALVLVAVVIAGCGTAARGGADDSSEAALRRHAVAVRTKPLWLDALFAIRARRSTYMYSR